MYKVVIADDEKIIRIGMYTIIDWASYGLEVVAIVKNGQEVLKCIEQETIDLVITDIKMPVMDGVSLAKTLYEKSFTGQVIMLTNHSEFELARQCLRYGVHDYLLKGTLRPEELIDVLEKAKQKLGTKQSNREVDQLTTKEDGQDIKVVMGHAFQLTPTKIADKMFHHPQQVTVFQLIQPSTPQNHKTHQTLKSYEAYIQNIVCEVFPTKQKPRVEVWDEWFVIIQACDGESREDKLSEYAIQIQKLIKLYTNSSVVGVVGRKVYTTHEMVDSVNKSRRVVDIGFYKGYEMILEESLIQTIKPYPIRPEREEQALFEAIDKGDYEKARVYLEAWCECLAHACLKKEEARKQMQHLLDRCLLAYGAYTEEDAKSVETLKEISQKAVTMQAFSKVIDTFIHTICEHKQKLMHHHYRKEIVDIMTYVKKHIHEKITLGDLAEHVNMNESYISRLFKNETGMTLTSYINLLKMEEAKQLLMKKDMIVKDVAYALGFDEQSYFNRLFNKYFGISPKEYRKVNKIQK